MKILKKTKNAKHNITLFIMVKVQYVILWSLSAAAEVNVLSSLTRIITKNCLKPPYGVTLV